jgi:predicted TIM-barrel fold metal-dependent hydrolase
MRIDVHHHIVPPAYAEIAAQRAKLESRVASWTEERSLDDMEAAGVTRAIASISSPGLFFGDAAESRRLARICNEYAAELIRRYPGRFGMFAALPLPDVEGALEEIAYAFDVLGLDGIGMFTSYGNAWLGDPGFAPVFEELNRRKALVFTHPVAPACCRNLIAFVPPPVIEFGTDTTRAIVSYVFSGAAARYPDVRLIFSHAGGTMPYLIERLVELAKAPHLAKNVSDGVVPMLQRFFYDTAQSSHPVTLGALRTLVPVSQMLFGTDFPFRTAAEHVANLAGCGFTPEEIAAIEGGNASRLLASLSFSG